MLAPVAPVQPVHEEPAALAAAGAARRDHVRRDPRAFRVAFVLRVLVHREGLRRISVDGAARLLQRGARVGLGEEGALVALVLRTGILGARRGEALPERRMSRKIALTPLPVGYSLDARRGEALPRRAPRDAGARVLLLVAVGLVGGPALRVRVRRRLRRVVGGEALEARLQGLEGRVGRPLARSREEGARRVPQRRERVVAREAACTVACAEEMLPATRVERRSVEETSSHSP